MAHWTVAFDRRAGSILVLDRQSGSQVLELRLEVAESERRNWEGALVRSFLTPIVLSYDLVSVTYCVATWPLLALCLYLWRADWW